METFSREDYLMAAVEKFRPLFTRKHLEIPSVKVSCGFPAKSPLKNMGECWSEDCTFDGTRQIFISPLHKSAVDVLGTLVHEILHSTMPASEKHGPKFKEGMKLIGLEGPARTAGPDPQLQLVIEKMAEELGEYPNPTLRPKPKTQKEKAQAKKSFKLFCPKKRAGDKGCLLVDKTTGGDYTVTCSRKSLKLGFPLCPCSCEMEMETDDWELYKISE